MKRPPETELGNPRIEIQLASLLMHAWSELRISSEKKEFENHYQLASFIYDKAAAFKKGRPYLGDVETLFKIFKSKDRLTPKKIENDLDKIEWYGEIPIAQQLIDLYADRPNDDSQVGAFLRKWVGIEKMLTGMLLSKGYSINAPGGIHRLMTDTKILSKDMMEKYNILRKVRNNMVHSLEMPDKLEFERYMGMIDEILSTAI